MGKVKRAAQASYHRHQETQHATHALQVPEILPTMRVVSMKLQQRKHQKATLRCDLVLLEHLL